MALRKFLLDTWIIIRMQVAVYRFIGPFTAILSILMPMGTLLLIFFSSGGVTQEHALVLLSGNIVVSLVNTCVASLGQYIGGMKESRSFDYYATLPISKVSLVLGLMCSNMFLSFPGFIAVAVLGWLVLGIKVSMGLGFFVAVLLTALTMASIGTMIGVVAKSGMQANHFSLIAMFLFVFLAPVYYTLEAVPLPLQLWGRIQPVTYGASAIRSALGGLPVSAYIWDLVILAVLAAVSLTIITRGIKWREG